MTRKDYELIAGAFHEAFRHDLLNEPVEAGIDRAASHVACALQRDNPRFDRQRFMRAARGW